MLLHDMYSRNHKVPGARILDYITLLTDCFRLNSTRDVPKAHQWAFSDAGPYWWFHSEEAKLLESHRVSLAAWLSDRKITLPLRLDQIRIDLERVAEEFFSYFPRQQNPAVIAITFSNTRYLGKLSVLSNDSPVICLSAEMTMSNPSCAALVAAHELAHLYLYGLNPRLLTDEHPFSVWRGLVLEGFATWCASRAQPAASLQEHLTFSKNGDISLSANTVDRVLEAFDFEDESAYSELFHRSQEFAETTGLTVIAPKGRVVAT
jgi:hypothetical protein